MSNTGTTTTATYTFTCAATGCQEEITVEATSKTAALRLIQESGWGGTIMQHCPSDQQRMRLMFGNR